MAKFKRKQFVVEKKIQYKFAGFVMLYVAGMAFLISSAVFFSVLSILGDRLAAVYPQGRLSPIVQSAYATFGITLFASLPIIFWVSIRFSHKIVGPLPKMYNYLKLVGDGTDPGKLIIREGDQLQDLAAAINQMAEAMRQRKAIEPPQK